MLSLLDGEVEPMRPVFIDLVNEIDASRNLMGLTRVSFIAGKFEPDARCEALNAHRVHHEMLEALQRRSDISTLNIMASETDNDLVSLLGHELQPLFGHYAGPDQPDIWSATCRVANLGLMVLALFECHRESLGKRVLREGSGA